MFIKIVDNAFVDHPIIENNFCKVFPHIDINNLPPEFAEFKRTSFEVSDSNKIYEKTTYEWSGKYVVDVHHFRDKTEEEKKIIFDTDAD
jgi:hypothetical protein